MKTWSIRYRIVAALSVVLAVIAGMGVLSLVELRAIAKANTALRSDSLAGLKYGAELERAWTSYHMLGEAHALATDKASRERLAGELRAGLPQLTELARRYETSIVLDDNRRLYDELGVASSAYVRVQQQILGTTEAGTAQPSAASVAQLQQAFAQLTPALRKLADFDAAHASAAAELIAKAVTNGHTAIAGSLVAALLLAAGCGALLLRAISQPLNRLLGTTTIVSQGDFTQRIDLDRRDEFGALASAFDRMVIELSELVDQVQKSAIQVGTSVTEIVATANEQQATATEVAATTTEIGATSKEISATSKELVGTMNEVSAVAEQTASLAGNGQAGVVRMEATMRQVAEAASSINAKLAVLNEKAANINAVVTTITKVADQTNLLSLNAAIEAEKAGEAGRGFAVVATEIRRLADQTSIATYDIEQTVKEIQSAVSAGVMGMDKFSEEVRRGIDDVQQVGNQLSQIIQQVQALAPRCVAVSEGMQAQSTGAEQISDALAQLTEASQQTVQSLRQSNAAIGGLNGVANSLRGAVARFKLRAVPQGSVA